MVSRYLIEVPDKNGQIVFNEEITAKRKHLKSVLSKSIEDYTIYNGLMMTRLLNRLTGMLDDKKV